MTNQAKGHSRVTPEGRLLGFQTARLTEPAVQALVREGEPDTHDQLNDAAAAVLNAVFNKERTLHPDWGDSKDDPGMYPPGTGPESDL